MATDYSSWKVVDLKAELKRRDVPQTGLRLKQQIIDKLVELDENKDKNSEHENGNTAATASDDAPDTAEPDQPVAKSPSVAAQRDSSTPEEPVVDQEQTPHQTDVRPSSTTPNLQEPRADHDLIDGKEENTDTKSAHIEESPRIAQTESLDNSSNERKEEPPTDQATAQLTSPVQSDQMQIDDETAPQEDTQLNSTTSNVTHEQTTGESRKRRRSESVSSTQAITKKAKETIESTETTSDIITDVQTPAPAPAPAPEPALATVSKSPEPAERPESESVIPAEPIAKETSPTPNAPTPIETDNALAEAQERLVAPSLHPPTRSLYICNLMRPVQPVALKSHLAAIATPSGEEQSTDIIQNFFLDQIRSHCFVTFTDVASAVRARSLLHDEVWPNESMRKPLWIDFIPDDRVQEWIDTEQGGSTPSSGFSRGSGTKRWEVVYNTSGNDVEVHLRSIGGPTAQQQTTPANPPAPSRREQLVESKPPRQTGQGFKALDELFKFTTAKPRLYYMPVSRDVVDRRLNRFDDLARSGAAVAPAEFRGANELRRYTFHDDDRWVCAGNDISPFGGRRGGGGGGGGGRGRRGRRGGGRFRDSWRGRG